ncbi:MAG: hypothetical protein SFW35_10120 [Chitinophagales bacterium]|nr:hypothetical protein [Chitinophagales bacterium]
MAPHFDFLQHLPDSARVWIYQSDRVLTETEAVSITKEAAEFTQSWSSHARPVDSAATVLFSRFLVIAANEQQFTVSGCGIDSSVHFVKALCSKYQVDFFNRQIITYLQEDKVAAVDRAAFEHLLAKEQIDDDTIVFNNMVTTKAALLNQWMVPLRESWHKQVFSI